MTTHTQDKLRRAALIHLELAELDQIYGRAAPSPYAWLQPCLRIVKGDGPWYARILEDSFIATARISDKNIGTAVLPAKGWTACEVHIQGKCRLAFSARDGQIVLHRSEPGLWENWFGVDPSGDSMPLIPDLFADDKDPRWRRFKASGLSEWPPQLDPTAADPTAPRP
ncbi:hypothetical protein [Novosphingobium sp. MMS21-SN21R]|uniref:hypothetical protein n=1 Tax=Novosphingobium sp. MMS21-SN21R TaxID=2969298 RepID=UPI00288616DB|nr:hypothetical protein [Novosphingobium sp. MMS21-SN21R]MDT0506920.1 hypothetical protein [Novosphingobium sp. MMS21-SN21R]